VGKEWARLEVWKTSLAPLKWKKVRYAYGSRASSRENHRLMWLNHEVLTGRGAYSAPFSFPVKSRTGTDREIRSATDTLARPSVVPLF